MARKGSGARKPGGDDAAKDSKDVKLNSKNKETLEAIFENPVRSDIAWSDIEGLLRALGGVIDNKRKGSRVGVSLRGVRAVFHEPHPNPSTDRGAVKNVRELLVRCGIHR